MIFNKDNTGSIELYNLTGTFYAANDFMGIAEDISLAESEVTKLIGKLTFVKACDRYHSPEYLSNPESKNTDDLLVRRVQLPVAYKAMLHYYQRNGVSHEDSGRKAKVSSDEKLPWAWQLEKDDAVMRDTFFRTLDELYRFLDENNIGEWRDSEQYKLLQQSMISSLSQFESVYPLDGSYYTFYTLMPFIIEVQQMYVKPISGDKYAEIIAGTNHDITSVARRFVALKAMVIAVQRLSISVFPVGISQRFFDSFQGSSAGAKPSTETIKFYLAVLDRQATDALQYLHNALSSTTTDSYPLIPENNSKNKFFSTQ